MRVCTICAHPRREAIETALVQRVSKRTIADRYQVSPTAVQRHKQDHLPGVLAAARTAPPTGPRTRGNRTTQPDQPATGPAAAVADEQRGVNVLAELERCFLRVNKLFDACDAWLTDPDDPGRYDIGPRAGEVQVTYFEQVAPDVVLRRKASLEELLNRVHGAGLRVDRSETRYADPRKLVLETASQLVDQLRLLTDLLERVHNAKRMERFEAAVVAAVQDADATAGARLVAALRSLDGAAADPLPG